MVKVHFDFQTCKDCLPFLGAKRREFLNYVSNTFLILLALK